MKIGDTVELLPHPQIDEKLHGRVAKVIDDWVGVGTKWDPEYWIIEFLDASDLEGPKYYFPEEVLRAIHQFPVHLAEDLPALPSAPPEIPIEKVVWKDQHFRPDPGCTIRQSLIEAGWMELFETPHHANSYLKIGVNCKRNGFHMGLGRYIERGDQIEIVDTRK